MQPLELATHTAAGGRVEKLGDAHWRLSCPQGDSGEYRLAQLDDYQHMKRSDLPWEPGCTLKVDARASANDLPGTWGFGFWNDPFGLNLGYGGARLLPALPNAAWFFFASEPNYLSFRDTMPAFGQLAGAFRSSKAPRWLLAPFILAAPLLVWRSFSRAARRMATTLILEDAARLSHDVTKWHTYQLEWEEERVKFSIDGREVFNTSISPHSPLGLVFWLDNQYAAWQPNGQLGYGTLATEPAWIEVRNLKVV